jgi:hypothetical protein
VGIEPSTASCDKPRTRTSATEHEHVLHDA